MVGARLTSPEHQQVERGKCSATSKGFNAVAPTSLAKVRLQAVLKMRRDCYRLLRNESTLDPKTLYVRS
jgi:hypothetical protein